MSLQVWLPLNGGLKNKGVANFNCSNTAPSYITIDNNGKIGKCFNFNSSSNNNGIFSADNGFMNKYINNKSWSLCAWILTTSTDTCIMSLSYGLRIFAGDQSHTNVSLYNSSRTINCSSSIAVNDGKWHHIIVTYNVNTNKITFYVDGIVRGTQNYADGYTYASSWVNGIFIGKDPNNSVVNDHYLFKGKLNDIRIYDHCLSSQEIKEISKGLVLHYTLDNPYNALNLIENGFGQDGTAHWSGSGQSSTTEIPPNTTVKRSFAGYQSDLIRINPKNSFTISCYLKTISTTSGTTYPSIIPYDIDKQIIHVYHCTEGFNNAYKTTLAQPLKKGDTIIYATNLSAWTTADNYYNHVAIFGYKDSTGFIYPDMEYTHDSPTFASKGSTKTNINKTNNTITLNSPYTGADRPAGTVICQATEGSTYSYPFGGIAISTLTDWVFKTTNLTPSTNSRLKYSAYWSWFCWGNNIWHAGIKITDNTWKSTTIYDCSGNGYNGTITGNLDINSNTPRNNKSIYFTSNSSYIKIDNLITSNFGNSYTFAWWGKIDNYSYMQWGFSNGIRLNGVFQGNLWNTGDSGSNPLYKPGTTTQVTAPSTNVWHHWVMTGDGTNCKVYLDGVYFGIAKTYKSISGTSIFINGWDTGTSYSSSNYQISDFRIYSTALSAEDAKALYEISAKIDKNGNLFAYNYEEQ